MTIQTAQRQQVRECPGRGLPRNGQRPVGASVEKYRSANDLERFARLTADALEVVVAAALAGDGIAARRVLRGAAARQAAKSAAEARVRQSLAQCPPRTGNLRAVASTLQLIAELGHIGNLVGTLARHTAGAAEGVARPVAQALRRDVAVVGRVGAQRIRLLAEGLPRPVMDAEYGRAGCELWVVVDHLTSASCDCPGSTRPGGATVEATCAALAAAVLMASRQAARAT